MSASGESGTGLWESLRRLLDTALGTVQTRVELFALELQEEKCRLVEALLLAAAVAALGLMTLTLVTFTVVVFFWENGRLYVLIGLSLLYFLGTLWAWRGLRGRLQSRTAFGDTVEELKKDRQCFASKP